MIFDLGDITCLSAKDLLKISQAFITHTHMDHFIGFDRLLRTVLGREKTLALFGPAGFIKNVEGKLAGYAWNLVGNYNYPLNLEITEVNSQSTVYRRYRCRDKFIPADESVEQPFNGILYEEPGLTVTAAILDHGIPCLGLAVKEHFHVNILKDGLKKLGLDPGPWLADFKQALYSRTDPETKFELRFGPGEKARHYRLGELAAKIALITPGQKISYITDVAYNQINSERIAALVKESDHLFIEAAFLDIHKDIAAEKNHLTAAQAGRLAAMARVKQFSVFHFSPRYTGEEQGLKEEARLAYEKKMTEVRGQGAEDR
jgi:ribonuclease Z